MAYINLFMHISSEKGVPEGAVAQIDIDEHKMLCDEIERLREALQFYASKNNYETKKVWTTTLMIKNIAFPQYEPDGYKIVSQYHTPVISDNGERVCAALKERE